MTSCDIRNARSRTNILGSYGPVAQRIEQPPSKRLVAGSIPAGVAHRGYDLAACDPATLTIWQLAGYQHPSSVPH